MIYAPTPAKRKIKKIFFFLKSLAIFVLQLAGVSTVALSIIRKYNIFSRPKRSESALGGFPFYIDPERAFHSTIQHFPQDTDSENLVDHPENLPF